MAAVVGFLFNKIIGTIYCSDISHEAIELSYKNISLLSCPGIEKRKTELHDLIRQYHKESHKNALSSLEKIKPLIKHEIKTAIFQADILNKTPFVDKNKFIADIVLTDVPYGNLTNWSGNNDTGLNELLNGIIPVLHPDTILAISHTKEQKITNTKYVIIEKIQTGHRKIEIIKLRELHHG
jgi:hypothetical protein